LNRSLVLTTAITLGSTFGLPRSFFLYFLQSHFLYFLLVLAPPLCPQEFNDNFLTMFSDWCGYMLPKLVRGGNDNFLVGPV
jgi:hypothetical protein